MTACKEIDFGDKNACTTTIQQISAKRFAEQLLDTGNEKMAID